MRKVKILSGVSGSGKTTAARKLWNELEPGTYCKVVSADDYFLVNGVYQFDPRKLSDAHGACFRDYIQQLSLDAYELVVVDNTNCSAVEIAPYMLGAQAYGWDAEILTVMCETEEDIAACAARNAHNVPLGSIRGQHRALCARELMPWWKSTTVRVEV